MLLEDRGIDIKIVEKNRDRCDELCELLPKVTVIHGDGSDIELLESEGMDQMDAFIALTGMDEENLIMSMVASHKGIPKIITKTARFKYMPLISRMGIDTVGNPKSSTSSQIVQYVRAMSNAEGSNIITLHKILDGNAEAAEFVATEKTRHLDTPLKNLRLKENLLIAVIVRDGKVIIPHGQDMIQKGDSVIVVTSEHRLTDLNDIFRD